uniref:Cystatin domain-containing protein n=1 Tax=Panagrellus redivivus TaxID=6233 RepID=A0A7E4URQ0_PANRE
MRKLLILALVLVFSVSVLAAAGTTKRAPIVGHMNLNVTQPSVMEIVRYGTQEYNKRSKDHIYVLKEILNAREAVNYRGYYHINVVLVETKCLKPVKKNKLCFPEENAAEKKVLFKVSTNAIGKDEVTEVKFE